MLVTLEKVQTQALVILYRTGPAKIFFSFMGLFFACYNLHLLALLNW